MRASVAPRTSEPPSSRRHRGRKRVRQRWQIAASTTSWDHLETTGECGDVAVCAFQVNSPSAECRTGGNGGVKCDARRSGGGRDAADVADGDVAGTGDGNGHVAAEALSE